MNNRIKYIRDNEKLSQTKFGERIGVSRDTIANIESGRIEIKDIFVKAICKEFSVEEEWLRNGTGDMFKKRTRNQELLAFSNEIMGEMDESFKKRLILALSKLDERDWETLQKLAESLTKKED